MTNPFEEPDLETQIEKNMFYEIDNQLGTLNDPFIARFKVSWKGVIYEIPFVSSFPVKDIIREEMKKHIES